MKKNSAFKMRSGNKPSMAKLSGVMKQSPAKQAVNTSSIDTAKRILEPGIVKLNRAINKKKETFVHSTQAPKGTKIKGDGKLITKPVEKNTKKNNPDGSKTKKKVTFAEAYKKRDMKTYGNLNLKEYTTEAKRQIANKKATAKPSRAKTPSEMANDAKKNKGTGKGSGGYMTKAKEGSYDAPKSQMKGSVLGPKTEGGDATNQKAVKTTKTTPKVTVKKPKTVKEARAARKAAKKAVKIARITSGRGSAEVKAAKTTRKAAKQEVKTAKKTRRTVKKVARVTKRAVKRGTKAAEKFIKKFNKENA
jgi:hypothetical protein